MDQELKALIDDLGSFDPDDAAHSASDLADVKGACDEAIKALTDSVKGDVSKLDGEALDAADRVSAKLEAVNAAIKARTDKAKAIKARIGDSKAMASTPVHRPSLGAGAVPGTGAAAKPEPEVKGRVDAGDDEYSKFIRRGPFKSLNHQLWAIQRDAQARKNGTERNREVVAWQSGIAKSEGAVKALYGDDMEEADIKAILGINEFLDEQGGLLVATEFADGIYRRMIDQGTYLPSLCENRTVRGNTWVQRGFNDKSRATGSRMGGVRFYMVAEGADITATTPAFRSNTWKLNKGAVAIYMSEEQLDDTSGLEAECSKIAADELRFAHNDFIIRGTGVGQPLGLLNAPCKVTATSSSGNTTIKATDIDAMWKRRADVSKRKYVWLGNQDIEPQLAQLSYTVSVSGTNTNIAATWLYVPAGGIAEEQPARLKGRPLYYTEFNESLGTEGDLILWDPTEYTWVTKATGISGSMSMHVQFLTDQRVYKWTSRFDGRPNWEAALTRYKGSDTSSPIITLETDRS